MVGGFIDDIEKFDAAFFGISPREAEDIDPQQRLLLELAWLCIEDAAVKPHDLSKLVTGVYTGVINHDYERLLLANHSKISAFTGLGRSTSIASNRISYCFDFNGPSVTIDTACSSSLTAVDSACKALAAGEIDVAFAGGVNAILSSESYIEFSQASMLSKSGKCHAFDANADGFVRAEGAGLILLKRLADALADEDRIHATILATTVNQDGKTSGIMAPDPHAQMQMMQSCLTSCGLNASDVDFVEAHGTGTQLGDFIEGKSIGTIYGNARRTNALPIGSVKTNIGHTESAAGIAGLIKTVLAIKNKHIPPNLNFEVPNPKLDLDKLGIRIPVDAEPWPTTNKKPRIAAVNSFGFGGTNAHAIVAQAPSARMAAKSEANQSLVLPLSSTTEHSLQELQSQIEKITAKDQNFIGDLCYTLGKKTHFKIRNATVVSKNSTVRFVSQDELPKLGLKDSEAAVVFVFNGIGTSWLPSKPNLYSSEPVFRSVINLCDDLFRSPFQCFSRTLIL